MRCMGDACSRIQEIFITQNEVQMVIPKLSKDDAFQFQIEETVSHALIEDDIINYYGAGATL